MQARLPPDRRTSCNARPDHTFESNPFVSIHGHAEEITSRILLIPRQATVSGAAYCAGSGLDASARQTDRGKIFAAGRVRERGPEGCRSVFISAGNNR